MKPAALLLANVGVTCAAILVYHLATSKPPAPAVEPGVEEPRSADAPPRPPDALPPASFAPNYARFEALERRVASMERALANAAALTPGVIAPASTGVGVGSAPPPPGATAVWTEDQLAAFRSMLAEAEVRKNQEQYAAQMGEMIRTSSKEPIDPEATNRAVALLVAFQRKIREIFPNASAGSTPEERKKSNEAAQRARDALDEELRRLLPAEATERVMGMVPKFPGGFGSDRGPQPPAMAPNR